MMGDKVLYRVDVSDMFYICLKAHNLWRKKMSDILYYSCSEWGREEEHRAREENPKLI